MRAIFLLIIATYLNYLLAEKQSNGRICDDIRGKLLIGLFIPNETELFNVRFFLSTSRKREPVQIDLGDFSQLENRGFDTSKKTSFITHGYMSEGRKPWCLQLKDALLEWTDGNVILVDWSDGSNLKNYAAAAINTRVAAERIFDLLQGIRIRVLNLKGSSDKILWNKLHFIGHSLGAHVSGQVAHRLRANPYLKVERITGLDPARPCFSEVGPSFRIDRENADFVDVYHTQIGLGYIDALGLTDSLGHVDFYVNGGFVQPECQDGIFNVDDVVPAYDVLSVIIRSSVEAKKMICSHKLATNFFIEATYNTITKRCVFPVQPWDGSYLDALNRINSTVNGLTCNNCPNMGMDAVNSTMPGIFLALTGSEESHCKFYSEDFLKIQSGMEKLIKIKSIFDHDPPENWTFIDRLIDQFHNTFNPADLLTSWLFSHFIG